MSNPRAASGPRLGEFVAIMALMTSLVAMAIDLMLPALADHRRRPGCPAGQRQPVGR